MLKGVTILFLLLLTVLTHTAFCRSAGDAFKTRLTGWKKDIINQLLEHSQKDTLLRQAIIDYPELISIPFCKYRLLNNGRFNEDEKLDSLTLDTVVSYSLFGLNKKLYIIATPKYPKAPVAFNMKLLPFLNNELRLAQRCEQYSALLFRVNVLARDIAISPVAFFKNSKVELMGWDSTLYSGIHDYVIKSYGCLEKYAELCNLEAQRYQLLEKMVTLEDCKKTLRECYVCWARYNSTDTEHIIALLLKEVDSLASLKPSQLSLLTSKMYRWWHHPNSSTFDINLKDDDLSNQFSSLLTFDQYLQYRKQLYIINWLRTRAMWRLEQYYVIGKHIPLEKEDEIFKKEVFYY